MAERGLIRISEGKLIRKFNGEIGMVVPTRPTQEIVVYKDGWDYLIDITNEIMAIADPTQPWMYVPSHWDDDKIWDECTVWSRTSRRMTISELEDNDDVHATLGYRLVIKED